MESTSIKQEIRNFVEKGFRLSEIGDAENIFSRAGVHSLFFMQLLIFIEKTFSIELYDGEFDINKLQTINQIAKLIEKKVDVYA